MRIVFMGTPDFAVPSLDGLVDAGFAPIAVVTGPDRARGRGRNVSPTPIGKAAERHGIETVLKPDSVKDPVFAEEIKVLSPDLIVVVAFRILPPAVFSAARSGAFNLHGSILPRYRGAAPIHHAVMRGDRETGVTTFFLQERVDTGNIILTRRMTIGPYETTGDIHDRMMHLGAEAVVETVRLVDRGAAHPRAQDDALATPAPKVHRHQGEVDWSKDARAVHNHIRGMSPAPCAWSEMDGKLLKLYRSRPAAGGGMPGTVLSNEGELVVACGQGAVAVTELQAPGGRRLASRDFLRGNTIQVGAVFGSAPETP